MATTTSISDSARAAIRAALDVLTPHAGEPRIAALTTRLQVIGDARDHEQPEEEDRLVKALLDCEEIAKSESLPAATREQARKAALALQREQLARVNPVAADAWQATSGVRHGID